MVTLSSLPKIFPAYNNNLILDAYYTGATSRHYYQFQIYINNVNVDNFNYFSNPLDFHAVINLSTVLSTYFITSVYATTGITTFEKVSDSVKAYQVKVLVYNSGNTYVTSGQTAVAYVFNGCVNDEESFVMADYIMQTGSTGNFLTKWHTNRSITLGDYAYLQCITGNYGSGYKSAFGGVTITRYQNNGTSSAITETYSDNTSKSIVNIDLTPNSINTWHIGFFDQDTAYYTIEEVNGYQKEIMRIDIVKEYKISKYYNFLYVNRLGGLDFFTFCKVSDDEYKIDKEQLEQFVNRKTYYTTSERTTTVLSQYISAYQAQKLEELFSSEAVKLFFNGKMNDVTVTSNKIVVPDRYPHDKFIQFEVQFKYNYKNYVQQY